MKFPRNTSLRFAAGAAVTLALLAAGIATFPKSSETETSSVATAVPREQHSPVRSTPLQFPEQAVLRPLPVSLTSASHEWTDGNASDPAVIEKLAHNPDEAIRMIEENKRIHRRQLVYRNQTAAAVVQQAMSRGEEVRRLTLPGLDGQELDFEVVRANVDPSGWSGSLAGRLVGKPDSMVILSFRGDREAFSVSSPSDDFHLQADPREPGQVIVKSIDPATYIDKTCGNPDHDH
ncbi:MAG: hypothetical protein KDN05_24525 [Verrucomicrobiae bacterium]|nr:hypothetical protein [Verrucomicrobiae bacterium]